MQVRSFLVYLTLKSRSKVTDPSKIPFHKEGPPTVCSFHRNLHRVDKTRVLLRARVHHFPLFLEIHIVPMIFVFHSLKFFFTIF
jgi:hypothetical protein